LCTVLCEVELALGLVLRVGKRYAVVRWGVTRVERHEVDWVNGVCNLTSFKPAAGR